MHTTESALYQGIVVAAICICLLVFLFLGILINVQRKYRKRVRENFEKEVIDMEQEIARIAADLHDDIGAILFAAKLKMDGLEYLSEQSARKGKEAMQMVQEGADKVKVIAKAMAPASLKAKGLVYAIKTLLTPLQMAGGVSIEFDADEITEPDEGKAIHLYRIVQEVVHNCLKHAAAKTLRITMLEDRGWLYLLMEDDGIGFDYKEVCKEAKGHGIVNIKNRVDYMGGRVHLVSRVGDGCRWEVRVAVGS